jgi:leucyl-tRNA synthetase
LPTYEKYWLKVWRDRHVFETEPITNKKKAFVTFPYPYMEGPVHVGHCFTSTRADVYARFKRMQGFNVLFPWAWHWTGESIVGMSYRLAQGDPSARKLFLEVAKIPESELTKFTDPEYLASYYTKLSREVVKATGFSIDWRREFTTVDPAYKKFIEWQYLRLRELGYVVQGTHPVVWCDHDKSPTSDHDRLEGEGVEPEDFKLLKFKLGDYFLVAGTLRPETIFGATNVWVNPQAEYSEARVDDELWVVSSSTLQKLLDQQHSVTPLRSFKGSELIGRKTEAPLTHAPLPVLPANFVDPDLVTGVVYSVPAHAPYDYMGLRDIQTGRALVSPSVRQIADTIKPISIIKVEGYSDIPAEDVIEKLQIADSLDPKLDIATKEVYKEEFHSGKMKENCGKVAGKSVSEAKELVVVEMQGSGSLASMLELPERVVCRCGTRCYVKVLENQWFLNYSDPEWKKKTKELMDKAKVLPSESLEWYYATIDWLQNRACARRSGMGTKLPWDKEWIVETLSDSTIYMAYYTISHQVNAERIKPSELSPEVLDFIFFGKGAAIRLSKKSGINVKLLNSMRTEFLYWYPVDLRNSAKELIPNHLTFFAFHHAALFEKKHWPRGFSVNGMLQTEGQKMSKSKGNIVSWTEALERYGPDALRATLVLAAEGMDDPDWRAKNAEDMVAKISSLLVFIESSMKNSVQRKPNHLDNWLVSVFHRRIGTVTSALEEMRTRKAVSAALLDTWNDVRWYLRRTQKPRLQTLKDVFDSWIRLLAPFIPFTSEEMNKRLGGKGLISTADWPSPDDFELDEGAEVSELVVTRAMEDARNILKVIKEPKKLLNVYVASDKVHQLFKELAVLGQNPKSRGQVMKKLAAGGLKPEKVIKLQHDLGQDLVSRVVALPDYDEYSILKDASDFMEQELNLRVNIFKVGNKGIKDPGKRAQEALPVKPAFFLQ